MTPASPQVGTLDTLVGLSDQLQKLDPFVEKYVHHSIVVLLVSMVPLRHHRCMGL